MGASAIHLLFLTVVLSPIAPSTKGHNITEILWNFSDYTLFNSYLTQTRLSDEINSRHTITVLVLNNTAMTKLAAKHPLSAVKDALSLHVLLDYFDAAKLHMIPAGTIITTTLYQTTGKAGGNLGFVNITELRGGRVGFGSAASPGSVLHSTYAKEVKTIPYNISVLQISQPIIAPGVLTAPAPDLNITALLEKAGCKTFAALIVSTGVLKVYQASAVKGLTLFAPPDEAFKARNVPDLSKLSNADLISLLQYHALASYAPIGTLKMTKDPISTLATGGAGKYDLTVTTADDEVTLNAGRDSSRIASTVVDSTPLCIFTVGSVLLPTELFGEAPSPAPAAEPVSSPLPSPSPVPVVSAPVPAKAPSSVFSPPAPPVETPGGAPAEVPSQSGKSRSGSAGGGVKALALFEVVLTLFATVIVSVFLS